MSRTPQQNRIIADDVRAYCETLGLSEVETCASVETALIAHSVAAGRKTAERLKQKLQAREERSRIYA